MKILQKNSAFSFIETLAALSILGIITCIAAPSLSGLYKRHLAMLSTDTIERALSFARTQAAYQHAQITVCPADVENNCAPQGKTLAVISGAQVLATFELKVSVSYRGFPHHQYATFLPSGESKTNGAFVAHDYRVVVAQGGRYRKESRLL